MAIMYQILNNQEQRDFIRMYPFWYKELSRYPEKYETFVNEIEQLKRQSQPSRLQRFEQQLSFAQMMMKMVSNN